MLLYHLILIDINPAANITAINSTKCIGRNVNNKAHQTVRHWMQSNGLNRFIIGIFSMRFSMICPLNTLMK
jgi:hypothetical protein